MKPVSSRRAPDRGGDSEKTASGGLSSHLSAACTGSRIDTPSPDRYRAMLLDFDRELPINLSRNESQRNHSKEGSRSVGADALHLRARADG